MNVYQMSINLLSVGYFPLHKIRNETNLIAILIHL